MLMVVSPAKSLDFETRPGTRKFSQPEFLEESNALVKDLRKLEPDDLTELMSISPSLAEENHRRFANWHTPFDLKNSKQAIFAFKGDVYLGLDAERFSAADITFAQKHLRILSGLYGVLRPLDLMQPYRLEMGRKFASGKANSLYEFWGERLTQFLNDELAQHKGKSRVLINLASNEYFNSIKPKTLVAPIITPVFKDYSGGKYKIVSFFAKKARGLMARYIIQNKVTTMDELLKFDLGGYVYNQGLSKPNAPVFTREEQ